MTYNVFSGTLNPTHLLTYLASSSIKDQAVTEYYFLFAIGQKFYDVICLQPFFERSFDKFSWSGVM